MVGLKIRCFSGVISYFLSKNSTLKFSLLLTDFLPGGPYWNTKHWYTNIRCPPMANVVKRSQSHLGKCGNNRYLPRLVLRHLYA